MCRPRTATTPCSIGAAGAAEAGAFFFLDVVVDELAKHRQLRRPLLARLVAGLQHFLQLLLDDLVLVGALERKAARLLVF